MKIPIASDHAGFEAKTKIISKLQEMGYKVEDFGPFTDERVDYPDYAVKVSEAVNNGHQPIGILICGSGQGMCMTANKFENVRAALVYDAEVASLTRQHNDANIICLPSRFVDYALAQDMAQVFLETDFEGGRHQKRVDKISC